MHVARIGFTPLKGGRHQTHGSVLLTKTGPLGDRAFCLVDPAVARCLRTVENPTLLQTRASWDGVVLSVETPPGAAIGEPVSSGEIREVDYWGRTAVVELVEGPWAAAYSAHLGREVVLASSCCRTRTMTMAASLPLMMSSTETTPWVMTRDGHDVVRGHPVASSGQSGALR